MFHLLQFNMLLSFCTQVISQNNKLNDVFIFALFKATIIVITIFEWFVLEFFNWKEFSEYDFPSK